MYSVHKESRLHKLVYQVLYSDSKVLLTLNHNVIVLLQHSFTVFNWN